MTAPRAAALALLLIGCGEPEPVSPAAEAAPAEEPGPVSPSTEAASAVEPPPAPIEIPSPRPSTPAADLPPAPTEGCAMGEPVRVEAGGWASVAALDDGFAVLGSAPAGQGERVFVARVAPDGSTSVIARGALEHAVPPGHRRAVPAVASSRERVAVAIVDGRRRLLVAELDASAAGAALTFAPVGEDASLRFAPALARSGEAWALAWAEEHGESLRVRAGLFSGGALRAARELRPAAGGAAAPAFVRGAREPTLVFLDPRAGVSVAHRARVSGAGFGDPSVARPINLVTEPPEIVAVRLGAREWLAYTAVGAAATTAVGLAPLEGSAPPVPLVAGTGYGVLHVDAAALSDERAVLVADAPRASPPDSPRELHVRVLSASGELGEPAVVRGPSGRAARGRIAATSDGLVAVTFTDGDAIHASVGRCAR